MQYAILDGNKSMTSHTGQRAECPSCGGEVLSKCGNINIHHWAHLSGKECDPWVEHETEWHREWKNQFPPECREVTIRSTDSDEFHRADVCLPNGKVIEFQHSTIPDHVVLAREDFYTKYANGITWVVNGTEFMKRWVKFPWHQWVEDWHNPWNCPFDEVYTGSMKSGFYAPYTSGKVVFGNPYRKGVLPRYDKYEPLKVRCDADFPLVPPELLKPVRWPHARKPWGISQQPVYFDSGKRSQKPEVPMVSSKEETRPLPIAGEARNSPDFPFPGDVDVDGYEYRRWFGTLGAALHECGFRHSGKEHGHVVKYNGYKDSDIFEFLGTANGGKDRENLSVVSSRPCLQLPKYIVGRFRPFNDVLAELSG